MKRFLSFILLLSVCFCLLPINASANQAGTNMYSFYKQLDDMVLNYDGAILSTDNIDDVPVNRLIVKTKDNSQLKNYYDAIAVVEGYDGLHILQYPDEVDTIYAYNHLLSDEIEYVEYDYYLKLTVPVLSSETPETEQTYMSWSSYAVNVDEAFEYIENKNIICNEITVAVIDTGIHSKHEYFNNSDRIVDSNFYYETTVGIDSEGNKITEKQSSMEDDCFHGTAVSSVIYDNTMSIIKITPYRVTNSIFIRYSNMFKAFDFAVSKNVDIINISAGGEIPSNSKTLYDKITSATNNGIMVIVAAGNENKSANTVFPACHPAAITVSATDENNKPASFSNFGNTVDIAAPGTNIKVPVPRLLTDNSDNSPHPAYNAYMISDGTSYSAPLVAAAAATLKSIIHDITPAQAERLIKETAYVPEGWDYNYGSGIIDFYRLVKSVLEPEGSESPVIKLNSNDKFEIEQFALSNSTYYTLDGSEPTPENGFIYSSPLDLSKKTVSIIKAASYKNDEQIGETAVYKMSSYETLKMNYKDTKHPISSTYTKKIRWSSSDPNIATVDSEGNIKAVGVGETQVTAKLSSGKRIIYNVKVEYSKLQWFIMVFLCGFLWYI